MAATYSANINLIVRRPVIYRRGSRAREVHAGLEQEGARQVYQPVQYLGAKGRSIPAVLKVIDDLRRFGLAIDLFSGSSVVAQAFAATGRSVHANDTSPMCALLSRAMLGIGLTPGMSAVDALEQIRGDRPIYNCIPDRWKDCLAAEDTAVESGDGAQLLVQSLQLPTFGDVDQPPAFREHDELLRAHIDRPGDGLWLISQYFAGSYFGVRQALEIDMLRTELSGAIARGDLEQWEHDALLTALISVASACAFSAGKHFAQPHKVEGKLDSAFLHTRVLQDRSISIVESMAGIAEQIDTAACRAVSHTSSCKTAESLLREPWSHCSPDVIYADPPYTAQQYSRFYHVLDTITNYRVPELQLVNGRITSGRYPANRFKSRFCGKSTAKQAMREIIDRSRQLGSALVISYSDPGNAKNARMITAADLLKMVTDTYGSRKTDTIALSHDYRQFNSTALSVSDRSSPELLVVASC